ncbi:hypothetical protein HK099_007287 [Clydaea vesicula]|uniref:MYND-type domain-containing protein n=1 Tax=Clydaea vesicula TaxID=447962 RepID=A0AAD5TZ51_9FUNG|nr:hypothetical protein HK099_007287 [Clydaea vesicula]
MSSEDNNFNATNSTSNATLPLTKESLLLLFLQKSLTSPTEAVRDYPQVVVIFLSFTLLPYILNALLVFFMSSNRDSIVTGKTLQDLYIDVDRKKDATVYAKDVAPFCEALWQVGYTNRSVSVSEDGVLRGFTFSRSSKGGLILGETTPPNEEDVFEAVLRAIADPLDHPTRRKPKILAFLPSATIEKKLLKAVTNRLFDEFGIRVTTWAEISADEMKSIKKKRGEEMKNNKEEAPIEKMPWAQQPPKRCAACKEEIKGKMFNCGQCKAVIYCSDVCQLCDEKQKLETIKNIKSFLENFTIINGLTKVELPQHLTHLLITITGWLLEYCCLYVLTEDAGGVVSDKNCLSNLTLNLYTVIYQSLELEDVKVLSFSAPNNIIGDYCEKIEAYKSRICLKKLNGALNDKESLILKVEEVCMFSKVLL